MELLELAPSVGWIPGMDYPDSDGEPLGDNDRQIDLMYVLREGLRERFRGQQVYITANVFWYPIEGEPTVVKAPDLLVASGRPPGRRRSYREWQEDHVTTQVVMEIAGPTNTPRALAEKLAWYERFGVEEYWVLAVLDGAITWYQRDPQTGRLVQQRWTPATVSPRLGIRFDVVGVEEDGVKGVRIIPTDADGTPFTDFLVVVDRLRDAQAQAREAEVRADAAEAELARLRSARSGDAEG